MTTQAISTKTPSPVEWHKMTPEVLRTAVLQDLSDARKHVETIKAVNSASATFSNTFEALESALADASKHYSLLSILSSVQDSPQIRELNKELLPQLSEFSDSIFLDEALWNVLHDYTQAHGAQDLSEAQSRLQSEILEDFKQQGAELPDAKKERLKEINKALALETQAFEEKVLDATNAWEYITNDEAELTGLPEFAKEAARLDALSKGHGSEASPEWRFTLHAPSFGPALQYLENDALRKRIWSAIQQVGRQAPYANEEHVQKILELRREKANLLGYKDFADLTTHRRMAKNGDKVDAFLKELHDASLTAFQKDQAALRAFKSEELSQPEELLEPWELSYWSTKRTKALYDFDPQELRPYFPMEQVMGGLFKLSEQLYGIDIQERPTFVAGNGQPSENAVEVWHPDVRYYELIDNDGQTIGGFYADWFPREEKRSGAWMTSVIDGIPGKTPTIGGIFGNMTKPQPGKPSLLEHREVETVFHEFGHLLHGLLGKVPYRGLNGTSVAWDFVELPSQIMENFCWERVSLDLFAHHYETGEAIPQALFEKLLATRTNLQGMALMRQLALARTDIDLHRHYLPSASDESIDQFVDRVTKDYQSDLKTKPLPIVFQFGHLFSSPTGYGAGYYSYLWAEVLDADAFTKFNEAGVIDEKTGQSFRENILSKGNIKDPSILFKQFMGREPKIDALLERRGILKKDS